MIVGILLSDVITQGLIVRSFGYIFGASALILLIMSVMLILQGLANQSKR